MVLQLVGQRVTKKTCRQSRCSQERTTDWLSSGEDCGADRDACPTAGLALAELELNKPTAVFSKA